MQLPSPYYNIFRRQKKAPFLTIFYPFANASNYAKIYKMTNQRDTVIEPEVLDENGRVISCPHGDSRAQDRARPKGDSGGFFGGLLVLAFGFFMTLLVAVFTVCVLLPLMLIGRLFGFRVSAFKR